MAGDGFEDDLAAALAEAETIRARIGDLMRLAGPEKRHGGNDLARAAFECLVASAALMRLAAPHVDTAASLGRALPDAVACAGEWFPAVAPDVGRRH